MATKVSATNAQQVLFDKWSQGTEFELDVTDSTKRQFNVLARLLGWVSGEEPWNANWLACFDEEYIWRAPAANTKTTTPMTNGSNDVSSTSTIASPGPSNGSDSIPDHGDNHWYKYKGFKPNPLNTFNVEFWRLSRHMKWEDEERRLRRVEVFDADFKNHFGNEIGDLKQWQEFCRLCTIELVPNTIPECMEALEEVLVNIYDLLDHKRTGVPIVPFDDFFEFADYTFHGHTYPLDEAMADTFLPVFLKDLSPAYHRR